MPEPVQREAALRCRLLSVAILFCCMQAGLSVPKALAENCFPRSEKSIVADVSALGDLRLASDSRVHLADIILPESQVWHEKAIARLKDLISIAVMAETGASADRWGRYRAKVVTAKTGNDLAEELLRNGLALVDAGESSQLCNPSLLAVEQTARTAKIGIWSDKESRPIAAENVMELLRHVGRFTLVEGRVRTVGERGNRTYLNFGKDWKTDFTVTISKQIWTDMKRNGIDTDRLKGSMIRVRGVIREWQGPSLDIAAWETLEVIDNVRAHTGKDGHK